MHGTMNIKYTHHTNTDIFTALSLLQTLDYIHAHIYTKSQEQTLKKHAHLSGFHFLIKKDIIYKVERLPLLLSPFTLYDGKLKLMK